jgi:hypothetical protein
MLLNQNHDKVVCWHPLYNIIFTWNSILLIDWYKYSSMWVNFNLVTFVDDIETPKNDGQINQLLTMH